MSTEYKRSQTQHGDPVLTITVTGQHDIYRLNWNLIHAQCEFSDSARKTFRWLRRTMGAATFDALDQSLTGGKAKRYSTRATRDAQ